MSETETTSETNNMATQTIPTEFKPKPEDMQVVLEAILARLQEIDNHQSSRSTFATGIIYDQMHGLDRSVFTDEIRLIRKSLGIPDPKDSEAPKPTEPVHQAAQEIQLGDL